MTLKFIPLTAILAISAMGAHAQTFFKAINPTEQSLCKNLTVNSGKLFFFAQDPSHGTELWVSDGTPTGTHIVKDIDPTASAISAGSPLISLGPYVYFLANATSQYDATEQVWRSDGTAAGTIGLGTLGDYSFPQNLTASGNLVFFSARDGNGVFGRELWKTNGTSAGTSMVVNLANSYYDGISDNATAGGKFTDVNGTLYFPGTNGNSGFEVFKSNGTAAGTTLVKDIQQGGTGLEPGNLTACNGKLYFTFTENVTGIELYQSDGTANGTHLVKDIETELDFGSYPAHLTAFNNLLYFTAFTTEYGRELWKSDGTEAGTQQIINIGYENQDMSEVKSMVAGDTHLFFSVSYGTESDIWRTDGTEAGTYISACPNTPILGSESLYFSDGRLYFQSGRLTPNVYGTELFISNGSALGVSLLNSASNGVTYKDPSSFCEFNGQIFFTATDNVHGVGLWTLDPVVLGIASTQPDGAAIKLFPNPASTQLTLQATNHALEYTVINCLAQTVLSGKLNGATTIDVSSLTPGIYMIQTEDNGIFSRVKFIKN